MLDALFNKQMMSEGMAFVSFELKRFCSFVIRIIADWQITNDRVNWIDKQRLKAVLVEKLKLFFQKVRLGIGDLQEHIINFNAKAVCRFSDSWFSTVNRRFPVPRAGSRMVSSFLSAINLFTK